MENKWISVEDQLPEENQIVDVWGKCGTSRERRLTDVCFYTDSDGDKWFGGWFEDVTHWMPLPNPPQST